MNIGIPMAAVGMLIASVTASAAHAPVEIAQTEPVQAPTPATAPAPAANTPAATADEPSRIHLAMGMDYTTAYFFRGILQEDTGLILQPYADIALDVARFEKATIAAKIGTWNSFHGQATGSQKDDFFTKNWYESDLYVGAG